MQEYLKEKESIDVGLDKNLVTEITDKYRDIKRTFLEYIDNGFDAALQFSLDKQKDDFKKTLKIKVDIYKSEVRISNNAQGLDHDEIRKAFKTVGLSNKKGDFTTNGEKGAGVYSFLPFADQLVFNTKKDQQTEGVAMIIYKDRFTDRNKRLQNDYDINKDIKEIGTEIQMRGIKKEELGKLSAEKLAEFIQVAFNMKLKNYDCEVLIEDKRNDKKTFDPIPCVPFDYKSIKGVEITHDYGIGHGSNKEKIKVNIVVSRDTDKKIKDYQLAVYRNNNRINYLRNLDEVESKIWNNPNIYGEIIVSQNLEVEINRTSFKNTPLYKEFVKYIDTDLAKRVEKELNELMAIKTNEELKKLDEPLKKAMKNAMTIFDDWEIEEKEKRKKRKKNNKDEDEDGKKKRNHKGKKPKTKQQGGIPDVQFPVGEPTKTGSKYNQSDWISPNTIVIFVEHPNFILRQSNPNLKITLANVGDRVLGYISLLVSKHMVDQALKSPKIEITEIEFATQLDKIVEVATLIEETLNRELI